MLIHCLPLAGLVIGLFTFFQKSKSVIMEKVLEFTSLGNAIISELLKVSELIPEEFKIHENNKKYNEIIMDFR